MAPKRVSKKKATAAVAEPVPILVVEETKEEPEGVEGMAEAPEVPEAPEAVEAPEEAAAPMEQVILHLPIPAGKIEDLLHSGGELQLVPEYDPNLPEPQPYTAYNKFSSEATELPETEPVAPPPVVTPSVPASPARAPRGAGSAAAKKRAAAAAAATAAETAPVLNHRPNCFWCCYPVGHQEFGMPIRYDPAHRNFTLFGTFCSLECASAYNFSVHMGSDRAWEVHSWVQMLARRYHIAEPVRPAPSRFLLDIFQGPMTIEAFRNAHRTTDSTYVMNVPPLVSVQAQTECINSSYIQHTQHSQQVAATTHKPFGRWVAAT